MNETKNIISASKIYFKLLFTTRFNSLIPTYYNYYYYY